jgi:hypothetical protein
MTALSALNPIGLLNGGVDAIGDTVRDFFGIGKTKPTFNDPAYKTLYDFQAEVLGKGLAEEDRFELYMSYPNVLQNSAYKFMDGTVSRVESLNFPPMTILTKQRKIFGPGVPVPVAANYGGDTGLTITFLVDRDFQSKRMFDVWMRSIVDDDTQTVAYAADYTAQIGIRQLDRSDNCVYEAVILNVYPIAIQPMGLSMTAHGAFHRLSVTFAYRKWTIKDISLAAATAASSAASLASLGGDTVQPVTSQITQQGKNLTDIANKFGLSSSFSSISL